MSVEFEVKYLPTEFSVPVGLPWAIFEHPTVRIERALESHPVPDANGVLRDTYSIDFNISPTNGLARVVSPAAGTVQVATQEIAYLGNYVELQYSHNFDGVDYYARVGFAHLRDEELPQLSSGAVTEGQYLGLEGNTDGNTGISTGQHLHIEITPHFTDPSSSILPGVVTSSDRLGVRFEATALGSFVTPDDRPAGMVSSIDLDLGDFSNVHNGFLAYGGVSLTGTGEDNILSGNSLDNQISGLRGSDAIWAGGGDDRIFGESNAPSSAGEADAIYAGLGNDSVNGGGGDDWIFGDSGESYLGENLLANERAFLQELPFNINPVEDGERVDYRFGDTGIDGNDDLRGDAGNDVIFGGAGNDTIYGGGTSSRDPFQTGNDILFGGAGDDHLYGELGNDTIFGGSGFDTAYYEPTESEGRYFLLTPVSGNGLRVEEVSTIPNQSPFFLNGTDILYDVERLQFADGFSLDVAAITEPIKAAVAVENLSVEDVEEPGFFGRFLIKAGSIFSIPKAEAFFEEVPATQPSAVALRDTQTGAVYELLSGTDYIEFSDTEVISKFAFGDTEPEPTDDHGDTRDTASLVTDLDGTAVRGEIEVSGDEDYFRFSTQSGWTYGVVATPDNSGVDPEISVYNSSGQLVASNGDLGGGPNAGLSFTSSGGTYYVEISGEGGSTGDYGIGVSLLGDGSGGTAPGDASEPDADVDVSTGRRPTHEGDNGDDSWVFSSSSSTEVFIVGNGGDDIVRTGRRDDIVFGGDGDDEIQTRDGDDLIDGGDDEDDIEGGDGNDGILGGRDDDTIDGGDGDDVIAGQHGDDRIDGGDDDDVISGGDGDDRIDGESGDDGILGDDGDDNLRGGTGNDTIYGGDDDDVIDGEQGRDVLYGDRGRDFIRGGEDADRIDGGDHDDELLGEEGNDSISGGSGDDIIRPGAGDDTVDGDGGSDTLSYEAMNGGATIDMTTETAYGAEIGFDRFDSIDHINGTNGNDIIIGDGDDNRLNGDSGQDIITGGAGNDEIDGGSSTDTAVFSGNRADYTISASTNPEFDLQIIDNRPGSPDGTDLLDSIAFLQFADVRIRDDDALSSAPTANDDVFEVSNDGPAILDVLANDTDPDGNTLSVAEVLSQPANGLTYVVDNRIVFDPNGEFSGDSEQVVSITYRMSDGTGWTDEATVTVSVSADESGPEVTTDTQTYEDGRVLVTTFVDGVRTEAIMTDVANAHSWTSYTNYYDDAGERVSQSYVYDNSNTAENTFVGGQRTQNVVTEADGDVRTSTYGADGVRDTYVFQDLSETRDWAEYTNEYDDTGTIETRTRVYDDGRVFLTEFEDGVVVSTIEIMPQTEQTLTLSDDFEDGILAVDGRAYLNNVSEFDGSLHLEMMVTDQRSRATIEFEHGLSDMTISYDAFMHAANAYFYGANSLMFTDAEGGEFTVRFNPQRTSWAPSYESDPDNFDLPRMLLIDPNGDNTSVYSSGANTSSYFDDWTRIEAAFDSDTGTLEIDMESDGVADLVIQDELLVGATVEAYTIGTYGWWTGHYTKIDDLEVVGTYIADDFIF